MALATSSGAPIRPSGNIATSCCRASGTRHRTRSVSTADGATPLTNAVLSNLVGDMMGEYTTPALSVA